MRVQKKENKNKWKKFFYMPAVQYVWLIPYKI